MKCFLCLCVVWVTWLSLTAQTPALPAHRHVSATVKPLTGANVPDIIAQRLVLINLGRAYSQTAKPDDLAAQRAFMASIGLSAFEMASLKQIVNNFAATWNARIEQQNRDTASGIASPMSQFKAERDALVAETVAQIQQAVTPYGFSRFLMYVQNQKQFMQTWEGQ